MATLCLRTQSRNCLAICEALTGTHTLLMESSSHRNLCPYPLSDPASLTLPATPCPQQLPHISHQKQPPTQASNSWGYSVTAKSPSGRMEFQISFGHTFLYLFSFLSPSNFITSFKTSTQRLHLIIQPLTDPLAIRAKEDEPVSDATVFLTKESGETSLYQTLSTYVHLSVTITDVTKIL